MRFKTNADYYKAVAVSRGMPLRSLEQVKACLTKCKRNGDGTDLVMARLMLKVGRLSDEAILYVGDNYPEVWE